MGETGKRTPNHSLSPNTYLILEDQSQQDFPIIPSPDDPDAGNVHRELNFPDDVYKHTEDYRHQKRSA